MIKPSEVARIARQLLEKTRTVLKPTAPTILRLDDALLARIPVEEEGGLSAKPLEISPRLLSPVKPPDRGTPGRVLVLSIDSSSRYLETDSAAIVVASVSVSSNRIPLVGDWPPLYGRPVPGMGEAVFIRVLPNSDGFDFGDGFVTSLSPAGERYGPDYSLPQAMDEARVYLENQALGALASLVEEAVSLYDEVAVVVDGPLYPVTGALSKPGVPHAYRRAWEALLEERTRIVDELLRRGARVYGVVKRVERARIISRCPGLDSRARACVGDGDYTDFHAVHRALSVPGCTRTVPGRAYTTPPIEVYYPGVPRRVVQYVAVPHTSWRPLPHATMVYRVEEDQRSWRRHGGLLLGRYRSPVSLLLVESMTRGAGVPLGLWYSDRRAKSITMALRQLLALEAARRRIPFTYETSLEVQVAWRARAGA